MRLSPLKTDGWSLFSQPSLHPPPAIHKSSASWFSTKARCRKVSRPFIIQKELLLAIFLWCKKSYLCPTHSGVSILWWVDKRSQPPGQVIWSWTIIGEIMPIAMREMWQEENTELSHPGLGLTHMSKSNQWSIAPRAQKDRTNGGAGHSAKT